MSCKLNIALFFMLFVVVGFAQTSKEDVLFSVEDDPVTVSEFLRVYNKNLSLVQDESQKELETYLDLYINYKLKIKEARQLGMHHAKSYQRELNNYKQQLVKNYIADTTVTNALLKEAYARMGYDVNVAHILFRVDASVTDTVALYNSVLNLKKRINNEGFEPVFKDLTTHYATTKGRALDYKGYEVYAEQLGYFSAFKMVYKFESEAYKTPVGAVSMPFRTRFGYHILKVLDKRPSRGEVAVKHIMVSNNQTDSLLVPEQRIKAIYHKLKQGESFEALAKQFSDDKNSASKGGVIPPFQSGQLSSEVFEEQSFALITSGEVSEPFETEYGWHIIKLVNKTPLASFEVLKPKLEQQIASDQRAQLISTALTTKLKTAYKVTDNTKALAYFESILDASFFNGSWQLPKDFPEQNVFLNIKSTALLYRDFANYLQNIQSHYRHKIVPAKKVINNAYQTFLQQSLLSYKEANLEFENNDFKHLLDEYREGLLLFDLMETKVWNVATKDTTGLRHYYNKHKTDYQWPERINATLVSSSTKKNLKPVVKLLAKGTDIATLKADSGLKEKGIIFTTGVFQKAHPSLPAQLDFKIGISKMYPLHEAYHVLKIDEVLPQTTQSLDEAKGRVMSDYQTYIEAQWVQSLKAKYKVTRNVEVFNKLKAELK